MVAAQKTMETLNVDVSTAALAMLQRHEDQLGRTLVVLEEQGRALEALRAVQEDTSRKLQEMADFRLSPYIT